jgi:hypothetical protein
MNQYKEHPASREQSLGFNESMVLNALELARTAGNEGRTVVLVYGISDQAAIDTLAKRLGRELEKEGVMTVPIGGATKIWPFLEVLGPRGLNVKLAGLYDIGEERYFRRWYWQLLPPAVIFGSSAFFRDSQNGAIAIWRRSFDAGWAQPRGGNNRTQSGW